MPEHRPREFLPVRIALMTVSDTRTRENDTSGDTLEMRVREAGHHVADRVIVPDDQDRIVEQLLAWIADPEIDVVISTGGTGLTGRDVTPEAFRSVFEKEIDGFSAIFHRISFEKIGTSTIQSRACGGVAKGTYLFALPGSPGSFPARTCNISAASYTEFVIRPTWSYDHESGTTPRALTRP